MLSLPESQRPTELSPLEGELLRIIGDLYLDGVKADDVYLFTATQYMQSTGEQTWEDGVARLRAAGLVKKTMTGKYRPTRLGLAWLDRERLSRYGL